MASAMLRVLSSSTNRDAGISQGDDGVSFDSGFNGSFVCGRERWERLRSSANFSSINTANSGNSFEFGSGVAETSDTFRVIHKISGRSIDVDVVDGTAENLPLLGGTLYMRKMGVDLKFRESGDCVQVGGSSIDTWSSSGLPTVNLEDVLSGGVVVKQDTAKLNVLNGLKIEAADNDVIAQEYVDKRHRTTHAGVERLFGAILVAFPTVDRNNLRTLCERAVAKCELCSKYGHVASAGTSLRPSLLKGERGHLDVFTLDHKRGFIGLVVVDEGTRDLAVSALYVPADDETRGVEVFRTYLLAWATTHGCHRYFLSDGDGCFKSKSFRNLCHYFHIILQAGPGFSSSSYGIVERMIRTVRISSDKVGAMPDGPTSVRDWDVSLHIIANGIRNEIASGGSTASMRSIGSDSTLFRSMGHSEIWGDTGPEPRLSSLRASSLLAYHQSLNSEKLRLLGKERATRHVQVLANTYPQGSLVDYYRERESGRGAVWSNGRVVGTSIDVGGNVLYLFIDDAGMLVRVAPRHVRPSHVRPPEEVLDVASLFDDAGNFKQRREKPEPPEIEEDPIFDIHRHARNEGILQNTLPPPMLADADGYGSQVGGGAEDAVESAEGLGRPLGVNFTLGGEAREVPDVGHDVGEEKAAAAGASEDDDDRSTAASDTTFEEAFLELYLQRVEHESRLVNLSLKNSFAFQHLGGENKSVNVKTHSPKPSPLTGMDAYAHEWEELTAEAQASARAKAIDDYDEHGAWDRESDLTLEGMEHYLKAHPGAVKIRARYVDKCKVVAGNLIGKSRLTPKGFEDKFRFHDSNTSPTCNGTLLNILDVFGLRAGWGRFALDFSQAFFQTTEKMDREIFIEIPDNDVSRVAGGKFRKLLKAVPGTNSAPRAWYLSISKFMIDAGFVRSKFDSAIFLYYKEGVLIGAVPLHVDDARGTGTPEFVSWFRSIVDASVGGAWKLGVWEEIDSGAATEFVGTEYIERPEGIYKNQDKYCKAKLKFASETCDAEGVCDEGAYRASLGTAIWASCHSQFDLAYDIALSAQKISTRSLEDVKRLNSAISAMKESPLTTFIPKLEAGEKLVIKAIIDAGTSDKGDWSGGQGGIIVGIGCKNSTKFCTIYVKSGKFKRTTSSSFDGECVVAHDAVTVCLFVQGFLAELEHGVKPPLADRINSELTDGVVERELTEVEIYTDSNGVVDKSRSSFTTADLGKRRVEDIQDIRECGQFNSTKFLHINGISNPSDGLTKCHHRCTKTRVLLRSLFETGTYSPDLSDVFLGKKPRMFPVKKKVS